MVARKWHGSLRVECPECSSKALAPLVDHAKPDGVDRQQGYCFVCCKVIGAKSARYIPNSEREAILQKWYSVSTLDGLRLRNGLAEYLVATFADTPYADSLAAHLQRWNVGTDDTGNCVFWYVDETQSLRTAKVVPYDSSTGKRRKGADSPIRWTNKDGSTQHVDNLYGLVTGTRDDGSLRIESFAADKGYSTCLYGAHFVGSTSADTPVLLVESEKSAIVASLFLSPAMVVVATGGASGLTVKKASILAGRDVFVLLDADETGRSRTEQVVETLSLVGARATSEVDGVPLVDYLLPEAPKGYDIADYYLSKSFPQMLDDLSDFDATLAAAGLDVPTVDSLPDIPLVDLSDVPTMQLPEIAAVDLSDIPTVELPEIPAVDLSSLSELSAEIPQIPDAQPELPDSQLDDVEFIRSTILRVFGSTSQLAIESLHERLAMHHSRKNAGRIYHAAQAHKVLTAPQLDWKNHSRTGQSTYYVAVNRGGRK